jgi:pyruvate/2-oxoglutarate/acetoin dehydrogenase E1 component
MAMDQRSSSGHYQGDTMLYRTAEEVEEWKRNDPIARCKKKLAEIGALTAADAARIADEVADEIENAVKFAIESPLPSPEDTLDDVYVEVNERRAPRAAGDKTKELTFLQAINEAVDEEMAADSNIFIMGEDVRKWGAPLGEYTGLYQKYGEARVKDTPIGAAAVGLRPIANIMFVDFLGVCGDEILNQLQMRYMYGGMIKLPLTIMSYSGAGVSAAHQHSKNLYGWLMTVPGLKVVAASNPYDAKGLLKSAIREDNPVICLHHKLLIFGTSKATVPEGDYTIPLGKADVKRVGTDVTIVALQLMVGRALSAAAKLQEQGISAEVIDLRTLTPFDKEAILDSVKKTGRLVVMVEEPFTGGAAGEIAAMVAGEGFASLRSPIVRVCAPDTPIPFASALEKFWMPDEDKLISAVKQIV